jgi:SpoVK/Ycf46/Vps4 family AAA+-type ATPase
VLELLQSETAELDAILDKAFKGELLTMPEYLAPGVYLEEIPLEPKPIPGVPTSLLDLRTIAAKLRRRRRARALFIGGGGTGKTIAARVIADELGLDLYRIDLSTVQSKYIGDTEKNLRRLFDAADDGGVILFFDEADALFGKRSEVRESHDRYANIETASLRQWIEQFRGVAILATSRKTNLDASFLRKFQFIIPIAHKQAGRRRKLKPRRKECD